MCPRWNTLLKNRSDTHTKRARESVNTITPQNVAQPPTQVVESNLEYKLLYTFLQRKNMIIIKKSINKVLWGDGNFEGSN